MSERSDGHDTRGLKRREFLSVGALPLAAALGTVKLGTVKLGSPEKMGSTPPAQSIIRIGLIGAGANVRRVQIPAFRRIPECEIMAVANRSLESSQRVADEFNIPRAYGSWGELLYDDSVRTIGVQVYVRPAYGWAYLSPELPRRTKSAKTRPPTRTVNRERTDSTGRPWKAQNIIHPDTARKRIGLTG